jgi:diguanylate cyclase (GGDEF)-like protein
MGGEEFCLLLPGTDLEGASILAERLRNRISELAEDDFPEGLSVTASFGVAELGRDMLFEDAYPVADAALYSAKSSGRNRVDCAEAPYDTGKPVRRQKLEKRLIQDEAPRRVAS